ncbi:class I SAM-dependent methyltransferase [Pseudonocardia sp. HH130630-07]|uniref:class I SAM-dependent methyltransferase n=1 Tax=Pseudonocardia sp. HH130630-07 TaxID=1690815 RepID=UPI0008151C96|nr:class I SAM-dependent methyltransferase [Pseudonocardia sp. HH130630-07]ANY05528.1 hypothetical protein AFB00_03540 [Pseudonocardia sp. HH130630-07]
MTDDVADPMEHEFDTVAGWLRGAVDRLGAGYAIPAACRGSGGPAALDRLAGACGIRPGTRLADVGAGAGGPAAYLRERFGARPVVVDPMPDACRSARSLFGLPAIVGSGHRVPLATGSVAVCWCLGVLCAVPDRAGVLAELHRVLEPGGALGLLVFTAPVPRPAGTPDGNHFPSVEELHDLVRTAGFTGLTTTPTIGLPPAPAGWAARVDRVDEVLAEEHGDDPRFRAAQDQSDRLARLLADGTVAGVLLHATAG